MRCDIASSTRPTDFGEWSTRGLPPHPELAEAAVDRIEVEDEDRTFRVTHCGEAAIARHDADRNGLKAAVVEQPEQHALPAVVPLPERYAMRIVFRAMVTAHDPAGPG